ncbi:MAG: adenylate/guanylate cyclase domain-containing protein [Pseudomonadota bacterium]
MASDRPLSSKELLARTGLSRATLNNYITLGLLPRPQVGPAGPASGRTRRLGYFPAAALERIIEVNRLKQEGLSMAEIVERLVTKGLESRSPTPVPYAPEAGPAPLRPAPSAREDGLRLTIDDMPCPAYLINNSFELTWWNGRAARELFGRPAGLDGEIEARNVFRLLLAAGFLRGAQDWQDVLAFHLSIGKNRMAKAGLAKLSPYLSGPDARLLEGLYDAVAPHAVRQLVHKPVSLAAPGGAIIDYIVYAVPFREGILFAYLPAQERSESLLELLSRREHVIRDLLRKRMPFLTHLSALVADLQDSVKICAELPPEEYFELINGIWSGLAPAFRKHYGTHGKHVGDGMVYYFFPQPDCSCILNALACAQEIKAKMREISKAWQLRKNWLIELYLNIGLNEGREWFGVYQSDTNLEFTVLGDTINHTGRLSDFARFGAIWVTKNMLTSLTPEERARVRFGVRRRTESGQEILVPSVYSRISGLVDLGNPKYEKFKDIATLAVTEFLDLAEPLATPA